MGLYFSVNQIRKMAMMNDWDEIENIKDPTMISFTKIINDSPARMNIWFTTGTVGTALNHPKQGKTQLFRKHVNMKEMELIFQNPRHHSGKGYK